MNRFVASVVVTVIALASTSSALRRSRTELSVNLTVRAIPTPAPTGKAWHLTGAPLAVIPTKGPYGRASHRTEGQVRRLYGR